MTKFDDMIKALNAGAKVIIGLDRAYNGAADIERFTTKYATNADALRYAQTRVFFPGVKYRTTLLQG